VCFCSSPGSEYAHVLDLLCKMGGDYLLLVASTWPSSMLCGIARETLLWPPLDQITRWHYSALADLLGPSAVERGRDIRCLQELRRLTRPVMYGGERFEVDLEGLHLSILQHFQSPTSLSCELPRDGRLWSAAILPSEKLSPSSGTCTAKIDATCMLLFSVSKNADACRVFSLSDTQSLSCPINLHKTSGCPTWFCTNVHGPEYEV